MCGLLLNMLYCSWNGKFNLKMKKQVHENISIAFIMFNYYVIKKKKTTKNPINATPEYSKQILMRSNPSNL